MLPKDTPESPRGKEDCAEDCGSKGKNKYRFLHLTPNPYFGLILIRVFFIVIFIIVVSACIFNDDNVAYVTCLSEKWKEENQKDLPEDGYVERKVGLHSYLGVLSPRACLRK